LSNQAPPSRQIFRGQKGAPESYLKGAFEISRRNGHFLDDQCKLCYIYGYLKGNAQNQIQPYIETNKISLQDVKALIRILEATFSDPDEVRMASGELDHLMQGNHGFSIYYAEFQHFMAVLDYDSKAKKATLK
jgi:hypothetical protein